MRTLIVLVSMLICTSCTLKPYEIQQAPEKLNLAVVFDIDGTLTPEPSAIFTARPGAAQAAQIFADAGYKIIYLSARVRLLQARVPSWLTDNHFPEGSIHVPQSSEESSDHAAFKSNILSAYFAKGWHLSAAFGDSSSDFEAYQRAGVPSEHVFALLRAGEIRCQSGKWAACWNGWTDNLTFLAEYAQIENQ